MIRWLSLEAYGLFTSLLFRAGTPPRTLRARFERFGASSRDALQRKHPGVAFGDHAVGALHVESVRATEAPGCVIVHLHGGAFVFGSASSYRNRAMRLGYRCNAEVFVPEYRLAPEHAFPAALDDAFATVQYVRALRPGIPLVVTGDSAGGGLAVSLLVRMRDCGVPMPDGAILLSPWTDLSVTGRSVDENEKSDRWLSRAHLEKWARYYVGSANPRDPRVSPVFASLHGLPPLLVLVGENEVLLDDARRIVDAASAEGTEARLVVGERMQHDWPLTLPWLPESRHAWSVMASFVERVGAKCARTENTSRALDRS